MVVTCEVVGTLKHYKMVKKNFELCALRGGGDKNFSIISSSLVLALALELVLELVLALELELALVLELELELALVLELVLELELEQGVVGT